MMRTLSYVTAAIGLLLVLLALDQRFVAFIVKSSLPRIGYEKKSFRVNLSGEEIPNFGGVIGVPFLKFTAKLDLKGDYPRVAYTRDSFMIRVLDVKPTEISVKRVWLGHEDDITGHEYDEEAQFVRSLFDNGMMGLELSMPGADVSPTGINELSGGMVRWAVRVNTAGTIKGFVVPKLTQP